MEPQAATGDIPADPAAAGLPVRAALTGSPSPAPAAGNAVEAYKAAIGGDGLAVREQLPGILARGYEALTPAEKELLKWVGVFFRKPTPGRFMMRIRMANGLATAAQFRAIAELSTRLGNSVVDITTRQQIELRGFTFESIPEIWEKLRGVDLHSLQTGIDNVRNINGCPLAGLTPHELFDASPIVREIDARMVGRDGNPEFTNLPRKFNITVTGCLENCTHAESQDIALVPATRRGRAGFNVLVGGKMGSGGMTVASPLDVFVEPGEAAGVVVELVRIYRDHGPRGARAKCRFAFLLEAWGVARLRAELSTRLNRELPRQGTDQRRPVHADHLGFIEQKQSALFAIGLCVPTGRVNPRQMQEIARLAEEYGDGRIRLTTGQNAILPNVPARRLRQLLAEPLLEEFSPAPSPFFRRMVACVGTDYCNLALIETKQRAVELSRALDARLGTTGKPLSIHWSGCPAGCGNHQAADIGFRGFKTKINGELVDAVAIYTGGRTGPNAAPGVEIAEMVPCDEKFAERVADVVREYRRTREERVPERRKVAPRVPAAQRNLGIGEPPAAAPASAGAD